MRDDRVELTVRGPSQPAGAERKAGRDRLRSEGRKEGAENADIFERSQSSNIKLGDTAGQNKDPLSLTHTELS